MRAVCFIPGIECLVYHGVDHWVQLFESRAGLPPTDIVLPAFTEQGSSFSSAFSRALERLGEENTLGRWILDARSVLPDATIWALIIPNLPTLANELIALRDQWDEPMEDACIVNPKVQQILETIFREVRQLGIDGVTLDLTDAYPNSTSSRYPIIPKTGGRLLQNTCFCTYCLDALRRDAKWTDGSTPFQPQTRNLARFVLKPNEVGGATPIDSKDLWLEKLDGRSLAQYSEARGFTDSEDEEGRQDAVKLLRYFGGRGKVTAAAVKRLTEVVSSLEMRSAVILGSSLYDMSQQTNLANLVKRRCADEYWAPNFEPHHLDDEGGPTLLRFLAARGSYYYNALFGHLARVADLGPAIADTDDYLKSLCETSAALSKRNEFSMGQCAQIPLFPALDGFVGIPFDKAEMIDLVTRKAGDGSLSETAKAEVLSGIEAGRIRLGTGDRTAANPSPWE